LISKLPRPNSAETCDADAGGPRSLGGVAVTSDKHRLLVSWVLSLGMFVIGTTSLSILGVGPALTRDLAIAPGAAGWLVTVFAATFAIAAPVEQYTLRQRISPRHLIVTGTVILAVSLIWAAIATEFWSLLAARIASAVGGAGRPCGCWAGQYPHRVFKAMMTAPIIADDVFMAAAW